VSLRCEVCVKTGVQTSYAFFKHLVERFSLQKRVFAKPELKTQASEKRPNIVVSSVLFAGEFNDCGVVTTGKRHEFSYPLFKKVWRYGVLFKHGEHNIGQTLILQMSENIGTGTAKLDSNCRENFVLVGGLERFRPAELQKIVTYMGSSVSPAFTGDDGAVVLFSKKYVGNRVINQFKT